MAEKLKPIDRSKPVPYYAQVKELLRDYIAQNDIAPGDRLPSESQLCDLLDVSRTVVRQALDDMVHEGLLVKEKGRGTFVSQRMSKLRESLIQKLTGFYQDMTDQGYKPVTQVLKQEVVSATPKVAARLRVETKSPVIQIERLRFVNDEPIVLVTTYLPYERCPELLYRDLTNQSLYQLLETEFNLVITSGIRSIEAVLADEREAQLLQIKKGAPLMMLNSVSFLDDGTPIEFFHALHRGDRSRFEVELVRLQDGQKVESVLGQLEDLPRSLDFKPARESS